MIYWTRPTIHPRAGDGVFAYSEIRRDGLPVGVACNAIAPDDASALEKLTTYMGQVTRAWNRGEYIGRGGKYA